jgi:hypothetical protein
MPRSKRFSSGARVHGSFRVAHLRFWLAVLGSLSGLSWAAADPVELAGRYEYRTDAESLNIIGDAVCFFPDTTSVARVPRPRPTNRTSWFCFTATDAARAAFAIPNAKSPCGYAGVGTVIVSNYEPYLGEGDGHDVAELVRVVSSEPPSEIACIDAG